MAAVAPFSVEPKMGLNDEDEDMDKQLVALRLAALSTMKAKKAKTMAPEPKTTPGRFMKDRCRIKNNAVFKRIPNSNLISIVPISPCDDLEQPKPTNKPTSGFYQQPNHHKQQEIKETFPTLVLPQHRYCKIAQNVPKQEEKRVVKTKFDRYESSSSESSEESEDEGVAASGDEASILVLAAEGEDSLDKLINEIEEQSATPKETISPNVPDVEIDNDSDPKPVTFEVEIAEPVKVVSPVSNDNKNLSDNKTVSTCVELPLIVHPHSPGRQPVMPVNRVAPYSHRSPGYVGRSRSKSPLPYSSRPNIERSRSRSRSRSCQRLARSRSPRRYASRRSVSPLRRAVSPHYLSPRRRSPVGGRMSPVDWYSPRRRSSPHDRSSPGRRRFPSPRRRGSPSRLSPRRYGSPSPPRRHFSPNNRSQISPRRWVSPRRRKSPSPVKRNPSPPRRFSPPRRSPLGRRVSPPRRNPSPPRKLYPLNSQQGRQHSPRRYPLSPPRGSSPRRYNSQLPRRISPSRVGHHSGGQGTGDLSPWTPPLGSARPISPRFNRRRSISPRPRIRRGSVSPPCVRSERKSISPRPRKRRDSHSPYTLHGSDSIPPKFSGKRTSMSPRRNNRRGSTSPRSGNRRRKDVSPRPGNGRRESTSPSFVGSRRKSDSPRTVARRGVISPRLPAKRKSSLSPKRQAGSSKRSRSRNKSGSEHRHDSPPLKFRGADDHDARTTLRVVRENTSRSISLSPPPDQVVKKSPLRVKTHRREHADNKKRGKSKKLRDKLTTTVPTEKTDESTILEARRKKFENVDVIKPVNKKIRLKTTEEELPKTSAEVTAKLSKRKSDEIVSTSDIVREDLENMDDSLILDPPGDLWSDEESDCDNEGRFKSSTQMGSVASGKVILSFNNLLNTAAKPVVKGIKDRIGTRERSARIGKKKREKRVLKDRLTAPVRDGVGEHPIPDTALTDVPSSPAHLPASPSDKTAADQESKSIEEGEIPPDPSERVSCLNSESQGDLRATLSLKRAARSAVMYPFKSGDKGSAPGTRLVQSAILEVMGKKRLKQLKKASLKALPLVSSGENTDSHVPIVNKKRVTLKELMSGTVTLSADESTLTGDPNFTVGDLREGNSRNRSIRLRLGSPHAAEEITTFRKVKKLNRNNPAADQV